MWESARTVAAVKVHNRSVAYWVSGKVVPKRELIPKIADYLKSKGAPDDLEAALLFLEWEGPTEKPE